MHQDRHSALNTSNIAHFRNVALIKGKREEMIGYVAASA
jgi:hypothetical protein